MRYFNQKRLLFNQLILQDAPGASNLDLPQWPVRSWSSVTMGLSSDVSILIGPIYVSLSNLCQNMGQKRAKKLLLKQLL